MIVLDSNLWHVGLYNGSVYARDTDIGPHDCRCYCYFS
jgi:hypothetical protein